jgi:predicted phosphoribosyltransferase
MPEKVFADRRSAGRALAGLLDDYRGRSDLLILALPRGGVPVAAEVADALDAPLEVFPVRKLGVPGHEELAMGAIASGGTKVVDARIVSAFGVTDEELDRVVKSESKELARRERAYRGDRPALELRGRTVMLVDDGLATGTTMKAAVAAARQLGPERVVVAVPTAAREVCRELARHVDDLVCAINPAPFMAVGQSYLDFHQTSDDEVRELLARLRRHTAQVLGEPVLREFGDRPQRSRLLEQVPRAGDDRHAAGTAEGTLRLVVEVEDRGVELARSGRPPRETIASTCTFGKVAARSAAAAPVLAPK